MKRWTVVVLLLWLLTPVCLGAEAEFGMDGLWSAAEEYGVDADAGLEAGLDRLGEQALEEGGTYLRRSLRVGAELMAVVMLCSFAEGVCAQKSALTATRIAGALAITMLSVSNVESMVGLGRETVGKMNVFSAILLPAMATLTAATGHVTTAAMRQGVTVLFGRILVGVIDGLLIPLVYAYVAACCAYAAVGNEGLKKIAMLIKNLVTTILTVTLVAFVGYITASGAITGSADAAAIKATRLAVSKAVPVVGGILADAAESILVGAGVVKGTAGVVGLLVVLTLCVGPFLQLGFHYLVYKLTAALTAAVAPPRLYGLLEQIGGAFGLVLGMTGASALLLLFSLVSGMKAVTG